MRETPSHSAPDAPARVLSRIPIANRCFDPIALARACLLGSRNHPSIVIWSLCNEVLCETNNKTADGLIAMGVIHKWDPLGNRPVSANNNDLNGPQTILDLQGFDYATGSYDDWHKRAPTIPAISSETSSAYGDRGEYKNDPASGHVTGYDTENPSWGQTTEVAWSAILTRSFMSGGFTWTGWDLSLIHI